ncbi:MAG: beta-lactamase family protein, partial [Anaerolineae bacterium]|nr:beta-lactamase family protein [Anaerolineae bacterium]
DFYQVAAFFGASDGYDNEALRAAGKLYRGGASSGLDKNLVRRIAGPNVFRMVDTGRQELRFPQAYKYDDAKPGELVTVTWAADGTSRAANVDAGRVTFRHLLTHTSGLPAWRPLYQEGSVEAARRAALNTCFAYPIGARVIYSDIGLILLGMAIERLTGRSLDRVIAQRVTEPLGLKATQYAVTPYAVTPYAVPNIAPTEFCAWRGRRIIGEVHDENAAGLGGVAGHAGLFATAGELATFGETFLTFDVSRSALLRRSTIAEMTCLQAQDGATRRGLGFALWSPDPEASGHPFSEQAFGHTGFTGTSLWIDPTRALVVAVCTNRVYYGRDAGGILGFRVALHRAIVEAL